MKHLLLKSKSEDEFRDALLVWRNTPRADGLSPAQMIFGFTQNFGQSTDFIPIFIDRNQANLTRLNSNLRVKGQFDKQKHDKDKLPIDSHVRVQDPKTKRWTTKGKITDIHEDGRSYAITCDDGQAIIRNRRFLKPLHS